VQHHPDSPTADKLKAMNLMNRIKKIGGEMRKKGACRACRACRAENQQEQALPVPSKNGGSQSAPDTQTGTKTLFLAMYPFTPA
jgi:hypothetical protein